MRKGKLDRHKQAENDNLQREVENTFTSKCDIERLTKTPNGAGGYSEVWEVPYDLRCIDCAINQKSPGREDIVAEQPGAINMFVIHLPAGLDLRHEDRIVIGDNRYQISSIPEPVSIEVARTVYAHWVE